MPRRDPVEQLRALNEVLAQTAGSDPECAEHARRALDFFSREHAEAQAKIDADAQANAEAKADVSAKAEADTGVHAVANDRVEERASKRFAPKPALEHARISNCARELVRLHIGDDSEARVGISHTHLPTREDCDPLWVRQEIVEKMKALSGRPVGLLLVTGLREALCPQGSYWTQARQTQYQSVCDWIDRLACEWASHGSQLQIIVI